MSSTLGFVLWSGAMIGLFVVIHFVSGFFADRFCAYMDRRRSRDGKR